ncbi:MAG: hypothetical protein HZA93_13155 [Verrucomicrobia bacterium]|nr:hypothetical protein [Verrucomicrobiota bacterium]
MSKNSPALKPSAAPAIASDFAQAKQYWQSARVAAGQSAAFMVLMGAELERLFKTYGKSHGGARNGSSFQAESLKWAEVVQQHVGCSEAQAWRAREMFKGAKKRVALLDGQALLTTSIADMPEEKQEKMLRAVAKVTDGKTAAEVMREFGITKKEQGGAAKGGNTRKPAKEAASGDVTADATPAAPAESKIPHGWEERAYRLNTLIEEALKDGWWNDCTEEHRRTLHGNLVDAQERIAATLKKGAKS